jgi:hypothetical protein
MTGRRLGYCSGYQAPGSWYPGPGLGYGRGRGFGFGRGFGRGLGLGLGRGWRHFGRFGGYPVPYAPPNIPWESAPIEPENEMEYLKEESSYLKKELNRIEKRLRELEGEKK